MYSVYVFDNKQYEVAVKEIKSILYDVVSSEEARIAALREKAFAGENANQALQALFVQQDESLRQVLAVGEQLTQAIQISDACSKELKNIEQGVNQVVETTAYAPVQEQIAAVNPEQAVAAQDFAAQDVGQEMAAKEEEHAEEAQQAVFAPASMGDIADAVTDDGDALAAAASQEVISTNSTPAGGMGTMTDELLASVGQGGEEYTPDDVPIMMDDNIDDDVIQNPVIPFVNPFDSAGEKENAPVIPVDPAVQAADTQDGVVQDAAQDADAPFMVVADEPIQKDTSEEGDVIATDSDGGTQADEDQAKEDDISKHLIMAYNDSLSTVTEEKKEDEEAEAAEGQIATGEETVEATQEAQIDASVGGENQEVDSQQVGEEKTEENPVQGQENSGEVIVFRKRSQDAPRGAMISGKQALKLRASCSVQEALLRSKGVLESNYSNQKQLEDMMNEANELYAQGKMAEAQEIIDKVSAMSKAA